MQRLHRVRAPERPPDKEREAEEPAEAPRVEEPAVASPVVGRRSRLHPGQRT